MHRLVQAVTPWRPVVARLLSTLSAAPAKVIECEQNVLEKYWDTSLGPPTIYAPDRDTLPKPEREQLKRAGYQFSHQTSVWVPSQALRHVA